MADAASLLHVPFHFQKMLLDRTGDRVQQLDRTADVQARAMRAGSSTCPAM